MLKEKDRQATSTSYMWAYRSGEDSAQLIVLFDYQPVAGRNTAGLPGQLSWHRDE